MSDEPEQIHSDQSEVDQQHQGHKRPSTLLFYSGQFHDIGDLLTAQSVLRIFQRTTGLFQLELPLGLAVGCIQFVHFLMPELLPVPADQLVLLLQYLHRAYTVPPGCTEAGYKLAVGRDQYGDFSIWITLTPSGVRDQAWWKQSVYLAKTLDAFLLADVDTYVFVWGKRYQAMS